MEVPVFIRFKSVYADLGVMNYFPHWDLFSTDDTSRASHYPVTIFVTIYIPSSHHPWPSQMRFHNATYTSVDNRNSLCICLIRRKSLSDSHFSRTTALWNKIPTGYFPNPYNIDLFKFRVNRHLSCITSWTSYFYAHTPPHSWALYWANISIKIFNVSIEVEL